MDAPSIKLILPPIKSIGITTCALGKFPHTQKKKRRRRRPSFIHHIHKIKIKNSDLHIFPHSVLITLLRVLLCLCIAASVRPSQGYYVPFHWCIRVNLMPSLFRACRPCCLEEKKRSHINSLWRIGVGSPWTNSNPTSMHLDTLF